MNRTLAIALLNAAGLMASTGALAQTQQQATIPFDFAVGRSVLPAGTYVISYLTHNMISVRGWKGNELLTANAAVTPTDQVNKNADQVIFHRYGNRFFLSGIRGGMGETAGKLSMSTLEEQLQGEQAAGARRAETVVALR